MIKEYETTEVRTSRFLWLLSLPGNKNKVLVHILKDTLDMRPEFGLIERKYLHKASIHYITLSTCESAKTTTTSLLAQAAAFQKWWDHCWIISKAPMYFSGSEKTLPCQIVLGIITDTNAPCTLLSHSSFSPWKGVLSVNISTLCRVVLYTKHAAIFFLLLHAFSLVHIASNKLQLTFHSVVWVLLRSQKVHIGEFLNTSILHYWIDGW